MENIYKRRRTTSEETIFEFLENSELNNITKNLNNLKFDNKNEELLLEILKKINKLENNLNNLDKNINKILLEKDYIIEELKDEITVLKNDIKDSKINNDNKYNYFY